MSFVELGPALRADFDESQHPRGQPENAGEFVKGGGGGQGVEFVSPNIREGTKLKQARIGLKGARHKFIVHAGEEVDKALGVDADVKPVIGMWADGAENSTMSVIGNPPWETLTASAAMKGWLAKQKQVLIFKEGDTNPAHGDAAGLASFSAKGKAEEISQWLGENGLPYHTLEPTNGGFTVYVYGNDKETGHALVKAGEHYGSEVNVREGRGAFLGTHKEDGSDAEQRADARAEFDRLLVQSGDQKVAALWQGIRDRLGPQADQVISDQTETPHFKAWFGDSKIVDADGQPQVMYHGTLGNFESFDKSRASIEGNWGAGFYFTNDPDDLSHNYAGRGPDITNKLETVAEHIEQEDDFEGDHEEALKRAEKVVAVANEGAAVPVFLKMEKPFKVGGKDETFLDFDTNYDEENDEYGEPSGKAQELIDAIREIGKSDDYFDNEGVDNLVNALYEHAADNDGIQASKLELIASGAPNFGFISDENGKLAASDILRRALQQIGFDGVIDTRVSQKFPKMGLKPESAHYIVFDPSQIKSAIGNKGTFDPKSTKITDSAYDSALPASLIENIRADSYNPNEARIPKGQPGAGQWTSGGGGMGFVPGNSHAPGVTQWDHAQGKLLTMDNGEWQFKGKGDMPSGSGKDQESLSNFLYFHKDKFKATATTEGGKIVEAIQKLAGDKLSSVGETSDGWQTYEANDFIFHVNPETGEYKWKPPKSGEAITGTGLHDFLDDMSQTSTFDAKAQDMLDALPKPPTEWKPNPEAFEVGGNEWNRKTGERLEKEFVAAAPELDAIVDKLYQDKTPVGSTPSDEDEEHEAPTEWDEVSSDQQTEAEEKWTSNNYDSFHESNVNNWYESGEALHVAKQDLANEGTDAPYVEETIQEFLDDWAGDPDDPVPVPYTLEHLMAATTIKEYEENNYDGSADPDIEFDDNELKAPTDLTYDPATQGVLPGMERPDARDHFTKEMREDLKDRLVKAFNKQADKESGNIEAPDYLDESTKEDLGNYWDQMTDDQKFEEAKNILDFDDAEPKDVVKVLDHPPRKYDPLSFNPGSPDYKRTQNISHALSLERAVAVLGKRGLIKVDSRQPVTAQAMAKQFTDAQATWGNGPTGDQLYQMMEDGRKVEEVAKVHPHMAELLRYSYDMLYSAPVENVAHGGDWTTVKAGSGVDPNDAEDATKRFAVKLVHAADVSGQQVGFNKDLLNQELTPQEKEVFTKYEQKLKVDLAGTFRRRMEREEGQRPDPQVAKDIVKRIDNRLWREWVGSSTSFEGKMIQVGSSDEFGGRLRIPAGPKLEPEPITEATDAEAIQGFGEKNNTANTDLRMMIQHHLVGATHTPELLRHLPHDGLKANLIPTVVQNAMKLNLDKDGNVKIDFDTTDLPFKSEAEKTQAIEAVEAIRPEIEEAIRKGITQRREDMNASRRLWATEEAKAKYGGYAPMSEDLAMENMQVLPSPEHMRNAFNEAVAKIDPEGRINAGDQGMLAKQLAVNDFWRDAVTKKDGKWIFDPAKFDIANRVSDPTFPNRTIFRDVLDTPQAREELAKAARLGFEAFTKWSDKNARKDAMKVYDDAKKEEWEPKEDLIKRADQEYAEIGGYAGVKALMRAKWETTQWLMAKAGIHEFSAYRGIMDPQSNDADIEKVTIKGKDGRNYVKLPGYTMVRNGAASTALKASVSNNWHHWKGGDKDRVVLRIRMPRTAALSVPSYGENTASEREVIVTGTAWKNWDAYKQTAPEFDVIPIERHTRAPTGEATATSEESQVKEAA